MIALFVALGGVSYGLAGRNTVTSDDIVKNGVKSKDIKNEGIKGKDIRGNAITGPKVAPGALGGSEINENTLDKVPSASNADQADNADTLGGSPASAFAPANVVRFVSINADGTIDAAESRGIAQANVTKPSTGVYCLDGLNPAPVGATATPRFGGSIGSTIFAEVNPTGAVVCDGLQVGVATYNGSDAAADKAITVVVY